MTAATASPAATAASSHPTPYAAGEPQPADAANGPVYVIEMRD
jgi:hypothetical protein